jgi:hypothetical protein
MQIFFIGMAATNSSCPGLSRASTFFVPRERSWMAATSPAMTMWKRLHESAPRSYAIALPCKGGGSLLPMRHDTDTPSATAECFA